MPRPAPATCSSASTTGSTRARTSTPKRSKPCIGMAAQPQPRRDHQGRGRLRPPRVMIRTRKKTIVPRSPVQTVYMEALGRDDMIFALGPAGTGKTYLAVAQAVSQLISGQRRPADPVAPRGRGRRAAGLPSRRHEGEGRSLSPPALRRALRHAPDRAGRAAHRIGRDRDRADRLHARPHPERRLHHPRRGAEHHAAADEDVPDPLRHAQPDGDLRRPATRSIFPTRASRASPMRSASSRGSKGIAMVRFTVSRRRSPSAGRVASSKPMRDPAG